MKRRPDRPGEPVPSPEADAEPTVTPDPERPPKQPERVPHWFSDTEDNFCIGIIWDEDGKVRKLP